jgi:ABC-type transporter Mla subunit MlaD
MTDERIEKIKSAVEAADHIPADKKAELLALLANLKPAIAKVAETHPEDAQNIGHSVEASAQIVARENKRPERIEKAVRELKQSVEKFEASHPDLAAFVNRYSTLLSALGF